MNAGAKSHSSAWWMLLGHAALAVALFATNGGESLLGVVCVLGALGAWGKALAGVLRREAPGIEEAAGLAWVVALGSTLVPILLVYYRPPGLYLHTSSDPFVWMTGLAFALLASYGLDVRLGRVLTRRVVVARRAALFVLAAAIGAWMLRASPDPQIDVFPVFNQAAQAILSGKPLYAPGAIAATETLHHVDLIDAFPYFPLSACLTTIAYALTGDFRWMYWLSQLAGGALLWTAARWSAPADASPRRAAWADLLAAAFLFHPRGPFVLEEAWVEPMAVPFLGGFVSPSSSRVARSSRACASGSFQGAQAAHLFLYAPFLAFSCQGSVSSDSRSAVRSEWRPSCRSSCRSHAASITPSSRRWCTTRSGPTRSTCRRSSPGSG